MPVVALPCPSADAYSAGPAFVGVLHASIVEAAPDAAGGIVTTGPFPVERINYDSSTSRLNVYGQGGNNHFAVDDNSAITTLDGGTGDNRFQIGQIYGLRRNNDPLQGNVATDDMFDVATVATTRGWVSRGTSRPLVAHGGHNNFFTVYSNHSPVSLIGGTGDNLFTVVGFALAETDANGDLILPDGCTEIEAPVCLPTPQLTAGASTAADTEVRTGGGNNQVVYNMNAPLAVDGGDGFNKLVLRGTEFADHVVVTEKKIFGIGVQVTYRNIQVLEIDMLEGDDTVDVVSTPYGMVVRVIGGSGSDQINVGGAINGPVASLDISGVSSVINHVLFSDDQDWAAVVARGIRLSVAQASQGAVIITEAPTGSVVRQTVLGSPIGTTASYTVRLAQIPTSTVFVTVSAQQATQVLGSLGGDSIAIAPGASPAGGTTEADSDFYVARWINGVYTYEPQRSIVLVFDASNWDDEQTVTVGAINDGVPTKERIYRVGHSVLSADVFYNNATVRDVEVTKRAFGQHEIYITELADDLVTEDRRSLVVAGDAITRIADHYTAVLGAVPDADVFVRITLSNLRAGLAQQRLTLLGAAGRDADRRRHLPAPLHAGRLGHPDPARGLRGRPVRAARPDRQRDHARSRHRLLGARLRRGQAGQDGHPGYRQQHAERDRHRARQHGRHEVRRRLHGPRSGFELHGPPVDAARDGQDRQAGVRGRRSDRHRGRWPRGLRADRHAAAWLLQRQHHLRRHIGHADSRRRLELARRRLPRGSELQDHRLRHAAEGPGSLGHRSDARSTCSRSWPTQPPRSRMWAAARSTPS